MTVITLIFGLSRASFAQADLVQKFEAAIGASKVSAAALVVIDAADPVSPRVVVKGFGKATPATPFRLGSITKTFTALALLDAAAKSGTPLASPAHTLIGTGYWQNRWHKDHPISLGQLVELSAGFSDLSGAEFSSAVPLERKTALQTHKPTHTTHWQPGAYHSYSNLPPAFSALIVEALTGRPFEAYLKSAVLQPLNMPGASLEPLDNLPGGFKADGLTEIPYWHTIYPAFGGLNATALEFSHFLLKLARDDLGPALNTARRHRGPVPLHQPLTTLAAHSGLELGYGAGIYGWQTNGQLIVGHGGDADGYRSRYGVLPQSKKGYFFVINNDNPQLARSLRSLVENTLTDATGPKTHSVNQTDAPSQNRTNNVATFAGSYVRASLRFGAQRLRNCAMSQAQLLVNNKTIFWQRENKKLALIDMGDGLFRQSNEKQPSVVLTNRGGKRHLLGELGNWINVEDAENCAQSQKRPIAKEQIRNN